MPKIKKTFTQREKDVFARKAFETIQSYFEQGLKLLDQNDADVEEQSLDPVHRSKFLCRVYVKVSHAILEDLARRLDTPRQR